MDQIHRLNEGEISDALSGKLAEGGIASCESCAAEFAAWTELGDSLRRDLNGRANLPAYFWTRQQARIRERLAPRTASLRWAAVTIFALIVLAFGLIHHGIAPKPEIVQTAPKVAVVQMAQADPDDALLQDIQVSLQREVPAPLMPASVLLEEMASATQAKQVKEN